MSKILLSKSEPEKSSNFQTKFGKENSNFTSVKLSPARQYTYASKPKSNISDNVIAHNVHMNDDKSFDSSERLPITCANVGFSCVPKQIYRKACQNGFYFNLLITGAPGLGKSTFINSLFMTDIYKNSYESPSIRFYRDKDVNPISSVTFQLTEKNINLTLTIIDTPGFCEALDNSSCWKPLIDEIDRRNSEFMSTEICGNRATSGSGSNGILGALPEQLIHVCFYFIPPTGHGLRLVDLESMRHLSNKVNLIPVIAKADSMTAEECRAFKAAVQSELLREKINVYDFPIPTLLENTVDSHGLLTLGEVKSMRLRQPFAVCTSSHEIVKEANDRVRCRVYPWGTVETDNLNHNDFHALKSLLMNYYMQDLIDSTYLNHYANFRFEKLSTAMEASNFSIEDGRDPLSQLDAERRNHKLKLEKLVLEMDSVYIEKSRDREMRLKDTEKDLLERIDYMKQQLATESDDLSTARRNFDEQRISWEMDNREYADSAMSSCEKLEKIKKRRGLF